MRSFAAPSMTQGRRGRRGALAISEEDDEGRALIDALADADVDGFHRAIAARAHLVLHLHRFDDDKHLALADLVIGLHEDLQDDAGHGRLEHPLASVVDIEGGGRALAAAPSRLRADGDGAAIDDDVKPGRAFLGEDIVGSAVDDQRVARRLGNLLQADGDGAIAERDAVAACGVGLDFDLVVVGAELQTILRRQRLPCCDDRPLLSS